MILIMRKYQGTRRAAAKQAARERIIDAAARAIRRSGYDGFSVAEVMQDAGLTHGTFYSHFPSREALLAAASDRAGAEAVAQTSQAAASVSEQVALRAIVEHYLSTEHLLDREYGCPLAALGSEMPRQAPEVRQAATARIRDMLDLMTRQTPGANRQQALVTVATMVGGLILARAADDPVLAEEIRAAALAACLSAKA